MTVFTLFLIKSNKCCLGEDKRHLSKTSFRPQTFELVCVYICKPFSFTDKWDIHPDELILKEELGSGQFGLVFKGSWHDREVAVKTVRKGFMSEEEFKEEAQVMM